MDRKRTRGSARLQENASTPVSALFDHEEITTQKHQPRIKEKTTRHIGVPSSPKADSPSTDYEAIRLENIRKNAEFLRNIGLHQVKAGLEETAARNTNQGSARLQSSQLKRAAPAAPKRRSGRVTVERLKVELEEARTNGNAELVEQKEQELKVKQELQHQGSYEALITAEEDDRVRFREEQLPLRTVCYNNYEDVKVLGRSQIEIRIEGDEFAAEKDIIDAKIKDLFTFSDKTVRSNGKRTGIVKTEPIKSEHRASCDKYSKLSCTDVAKLVQHRITSTLVHPSEDKTIVAAGDKRGNLGIWNASENAQQSESNGDIFYFTPHVSNICCLHCSPSSPDKVYSASYDGTIRCLNVEQLSFSLGFCAPEEFGDIYFTDVSFTSSENCAYIAKSNGQVSAIDMRASAAAYSWSMNAHPTKINVIQVHPTNENVLLCAGASTITLYDIRKATGKSGSRDKALLYENTTAHEKSISSAAISPDGKSLVTISHDDRVKLWRGDFCSSSTDITCVESMHKNNHTGRWLSTFRHVFDPKFPSTFLVGSMDQPRRIETYDITSGSECTSGGVSFRHSGSLMAEDLKSVCSRNAVHPSLHIIAGGNSSGRVHLFR